MNKSDREILRIIVGNQLAMMQILRTAFNTSELDLRIYDVKSWWKGKFNETVGPTTDFDRVNFK